jgi:excisionase family DNA binding protein
VSLAEVLNDLLELQGLASAERDPKRRESLDAVRARVARRERGAKVSEAAEALGISQPTVRAWVDSGLLRTVPGAKPVRIEVLSLAETKRAVDLIRAHGGDRLLLAHVVRVLRDRAALEGSAEGFADLAAGRIVPLDDELLTEIDDLPRREARRRSRSR